MKPILLVYATRSGHTRHIAEHIGDVLAAHGHPFDIIDAAHVPAKLDLRNYAAAILAGSLHMLRYEHEIVTFVRNNLALLQQIPTTFLSVSLAEATVEDANAPTEKRAEAEAGLQATIQRFLAETGWHPDRITAVAGALAYTKYDFVTRFIMKRIARSTGGPVDTSRDYEFTDWTKLDHMIEELLGAIPEYQT